MTGDGVRLGAIGRRLLAAFLVVALSSVLVLAAAALVGAERGLAASDQAARETTAVETAAAAAAAYRDAGGWVGADLSDAVAVATAGGAGLQLRDAAGAALSTSASHPAAGPGLGPGGMGTAAMAADDSHTVTDAASRGYVTEPVTVDGLQVGTVRLGFGSPASTSGRQIAWSWIAVATLVAVSVAVLAAWYVTRRLTAPLARLTATVAAFAAGDRAARADMDAPGELGDLARTFDATADAIEASERVRRNLSADVAHELRTPLAVLQAGLEELRDGLVPADSTTLASLHDQSVRLARIVNDLAALSAAEAPNLTAATAVMDLADVAAAATVAAEAPLRAAGIVAITDLQPADITADHDRVHQILDNLLSNVARYCHPGDTVLVQTREANGAGILTVSDTGPGIDPHELPHATDRFWRGRNAIGVTGSGLGLAIVAALAEAQHGSVTITSDGRHGTTVTVRFPLASPATRSDHLVGTAERR